MEKRCIPFLETEFSHGGGGEFLFFSELSEVIYPVSILKHIMKEESNVSNTETEQNSQSLQKQT